VLRPCAWRVAHFGHLAQDAVDVQRARFGDLERRTDRRVEADEGLRVVGLGHEFGTEQRHQRDAAGQRGRRDAERGQAVLQ
jgi:hypothetical protein